MTSIYGKAQSVLVNSRGISVSAAVGRVFLVALVVVLVGGLLQPHHASAGKPGCGLLDETGCQRCKECGHVCHLDAELVEAEKDCYEVESKVICIPRVVFPWQKNKHCGSCSACDGRGCSGCVHNGAKTRKVCVLKASSKLTCPVCEYSWSVEKKPCCAAGCASPCCGKGCASNGCDVTPCDVAPVYHDAHQSNVETIETEEILPTPAS